MTAAAPMNAGPTTKRKGSEVEHTTIERCEVTETEPSARGRAVVRDHGASFIEILISIVLLGTAGVAVLAAMSAAIRATTIHDRVATAQAQLSDAGDILSDVTFDTVLDLDPHYDDCATPAAYNTRLANDWGALAASWPDVTVTDVDFWDEASATWIDTSDPTCPNGAMQKVTLRATVDGHTRELEVVKRQGTEAVGASGSAWDDDMVTPSPNPGL